MYIATRDDARTSLPRADVFDFYTLIKSNFVCYSRSSILPKSYLIISLASHGASAKEVDTFRPVPSRSVPSRLTSPHLTLPLYETSHLTLR